MEETGRREQKCPKCGHTPTSTWPDFQNWCVMPSSSCILCAGRRVLAGGLRVPTPSVRHCLLGLTHRCVLGASSLRVRHVLLGVLPGGVASGSLHLGPSTPSWAHRISSNPRPRRTGCGCSLVAGRCLSFPFPPAAGLIPSAFSTQPLCGLFTSGPC